jgi:hypothetical protein
MKPVAPLPAEALVCASCRRPLTVIYRRPVPQAGGGGSPHRAFCVACVERDIGLAGWTDPAPCEHCQREVRLPVDLKLGRHTCSRYCSERARQVDRRAERLQPRRRCERCGESFQPSRAGQTRCSSLCRLRMFRDRAATTAHLPTGSFPTQQRPCRCERPQPVPDGDESRCLRCGHPVVVVAGVAA